MAKAKTKKARVTLERKPDEEQEEPWQSPGARRGDADNQFQVLDQQELKEIVRQLTDGAGSGAYHSGLLILLLEHCGGLCQLSDTEGY